MIPRDVPLTMVAPSTRVRGLFGVGSQDVTPPAGIYFRSWGAGLRDTPTGVHRPFYANVLTMRGSADEAPLVLVGVDGGWWQSGSDEAFVRQAVLEGLGLDEARVMINLSHTHSGPSLESENADRPGGEHVIPNLKALREKIITAATQALASEVEGELRFATGRCDLATNRSRPDPERNRYVTGYNPDGPADDTVLVGRVTGGDGEVIATLLNYACHPTTLAWDNELLSPDYVGEARATVEAGTLGAPCVFLLGACGELAPAHQYVGDVAVADGHGRRLGLAALSALLGMPSHGQELAFDRIVESGAPLAVWLPREAAAPSAPAHALQVTVDLPIKTDYPPLPEIMAELERATEPYQRERAQRKARLRKTLGDAATYPFKVWVWRLGPCVFVGQEGEGFSSLQTDLRAAFPDLAVVVMNVTNGSIGYLPPSALYDVDMYEVWQTPFARGCLEAVTAAAKGAIEELLARG